MFSSMKCSTNLFILILFHSLVAGSYSTTFTIVNSCSITVDPGIFHWAETSLLSTTGFSLHPGESKVLTMPHSWSGHLWGKTHCFNDSNEKPSCLTGDCTSSTVECDGGNASPPATLAEFNLNASNGFDYFSVSIVYGYNLPMNVVPQVGNGTGDCLTMGCMVHLNKICPSELKVMSGGDCIGCRSAFTPFSNYSESFKKACPDANVDPTAKTFRGVCPSTNYFITFCPTSTSSDQTRIKKREKNPTKVDNNKKVWFVRAAAVVAAVVGIAGIGYAGITIRRNINKIKDCFNCCNNCCNGI